MTKLSLRKISVLGLVLMAASAVTAAMIPNKKTTHPGDRQGKLVPSSVGSPIFTCIPDQLVNQCTATGTIFTTSSGLAPTSQDFVTVTASPTSDDGINTSVTGLD